MDLGISDRGYGLNTVADGSDEGHLMVVARNELRPYIREMS